LPFLGVYGFAAINRAFQGKYKIMEKGNPFLTTIVLLAAFTAVLEVASFQLANVISTRKNFLHRTAQFESKVRRTQTFNSMAYNVFHCLKCLKTKFLTFLEIPENRSFVSHFFNSLA
jgi:hypothetical protein